MYNNVYGHYKTSESLITSLEIVVVFAVGEQWEIKCVLVDLNNGYVM